MKVIIAEPKNFSKEVKVSLESFFDLTVKNLKLNELEHAICHFDIFWCSPPCTTFSPLRRCNIGRFGITAECIEEDIPNLGVSLLRKSEEIIASFQPKVYFIKNGQIWTPVRLKNFFVRKY